MNVTATCRQLSRNGFSCDSLVSFRVWWAQTGEDEEASCALHLSKLVREFQDLHPYETIKVRAV